MFANYLKVALRTLVKHKLYSFINIVGLATGMACCIVILVYVQSELSYDQYHPNAQQIFRVNEHRKVAVGESDQPLISGPVAGILKNDYDQVAAVTRVTPIRNGSARVGEISHFEERMAFVDPSVTDIFHIPFLRGDAGTAFDEPGSVVLSEQMARKYFGNIDVIGESITIRHPRAEKERVITITGVAANPPSNTHFKHGILISAAAFAGARWYDHDWDMNPCYTYVKIHDGVEAAAFETEMSELAYRYYGTQLRSWGQERTYHLQPIASIHFEPVLGGFVSAMEACDEEMEPSGSMLHIYVYGVIGLMVLVIACLNFINLSNTRSIFRSREVGLRKVVGAGRLQIIGQFLGESVLLTVLSLALAFVMAELLLPVFNQLAETELTRINLIHPHVLIGTSALVLLVALMAGAYPVFVLSAFKPMAVLKNSMHSGHGSGVLKALVVGQFAVALFLAIGTLSVTDQLNFMRQADLGFDREQQFVLPFRGHMDIQDNREALRRELLTHHSIETVVMSSTVPGRPTQRINGWLADQSPEESSSLYFIACDPQYISEYGIELVAGRVPEEVDREHRNTCMINEAALSSFGFATAEAALGQQMTSTYDRGRNREIVGVTKDFHFAGMHGQVQPLILKPGGPGFLYDNATITLHPESFRETMAHVESVWAQLYPSIPFSGFFLDTDLDRQYRREEQIGRLLGVVTGMGLTISCLGLLGLAAFLTARRTREIGIRKVLGASTASITRLLTLRFALLVLVSSLIACPLAWYARERWLEDFAYRVDLNWYLFAIPVGVTLVLALLSVSLHAIRTARANPIDALRCE